MFKKGTLTYYTLRILSEIIGHLSDKTVISLGTGIGSFIYHHIPIRKKEAFIHLSRAFPDKSEYFYNDTVRKMYRHFGIMLCDTLRLTRFDHTSIITHNHEVVDKLLARGKGLIGLSGHFGNWELISAWFGLNGYTFYSIIRKQKNKGVNRFLMEYREHIKTIPRYITISPREMLKAIRNGAVLGLASDQDARKKGIFVDFFGIPSSTPKGAAVFHLKTKAPLIIVFCNRDKNDIYHIKFQEIPTDKNDTVYSITQKYTTLLENAIREHPEQYFWFHKRWKSKPNQNKLAKK